MGRMGRSSAEEAGAVTFGPIRGFTKKPAPGTHVKFTRYFLDNVPFAREQATARWSVVDCLCGLCLSGRHVAVNEPPPHDPMYEDVPPERRPKWRHINWTNLQISYERDEAPPETPRSNR